MKFETLEVPPAETEASKETRPTRFRDFAAGLPRRDLWLIPLVSILTVVAMLGLAELVARQFWPSQDDACWVKDPVLHARNKAGCVSRAKLPEGPWVTDSYNGCGFRSAEPCGPKPTGTMRIALLGSSFPMGDGAAYQDIFPERTARALAAACRRPVEVQNLGVVATSPIDFYRRMKQATALNPDLYMLVITPFDVMSAEYTEQQMADRDNQNPPAEPEAPKKTNLLVAIRYALTSSRASTVALHYLYQNERRYLKLYLNYGDKADFLRPPFTPRWQKRFAALDTLVGEMADEAHAKGAPMIMTSGMTAAMAGLLSEPESYPGVDVHAFDRELQHIAARHGIVYVDIDPAFARIPEASHLFYIVDGHMNAAGHAVYSQALLRGLLADHLPVFAGCSLPPSVAQK